MRRRRWPRGQLPLFASMYGLDIETDTTDDGLDPTVASVRAVALSTTDGEEVLAGPEPEILIALDHRLAGLPPGVLVTWNGSRFDMPFLVARARKRRIQLHLRIAPAPAPTPASGDHEGTGGHRYVATWHRHVHLDAYWLYRAVRQPGLSCALKTVARNAGLAPIEVDATRLHQIRREAMWDYAASDARITRLLAEKQWPGVGRFLDLPSV